MNLLLRRTSMRVMKNGIPRSHATTGQFAPIVSVQQIAAVAHFVRYGLLLGRNDVAGFAKNSVR